MTKQKSVLVAVFATIMWISMILPISVKAQGTFEDDGDIEADDPEDREQQNEEHEEYYDDQDLPKYDEDTGTYNDDNNDGKDDDSDSDISNDLPRCKLGVVKDCVLNDLGQTCEVGTSEDACQDIYGGVTGSPERDKNGQLIEKPLPYCDTPEGKKASGCFDRQDYDQTTGFYPCNDGTYKGEIVKM
jgi:hypothetical protein